MQPRQQAIESDEAGATAEDTVEAGPQGAAVLCAGLVSAAVRIRA